MPISGLFLVWFGAVGGAAAFVAGALMGLPMERLAALLFMDAGYLLVLGIVYGWSIAGTVFSASSAAATLAARCLDPSLPQLGLWVFGTLASANAVYSLYRWWGWQDR